MLGTSNLTYDTLLVKIEGILNSRPLYSVGEFFDEIECLTPAHFLIGCSLTSPLEQNVVDVSSNRLSACNYIKHIKQCFWRKWSQKYLSQLQQRHKWPHEQQSVGTGCIVLVKEKNVPSLNWCLARVVETIPGKDGLVRAVKLSTKEGEDVRPITKICALPTD